LCGFPPFNGPDDDAIMKRIAQSSTNPAPLDLPEWYYKDFSKINDRYNNNYLKTNLIFKNFNFIIITKFSHLKFLIFLKIYLIKKKRS